MTKRILCKACKEREATCHVTTIVDDKLESRDLCSECYEAQASVEEREFFDTSKTARCQYCGGQPCAGQTDILELCTGIQKARFMCMPCSMEYNRFLQHELALLPDGVSQGKQLIELRALRERGDKYMQEWAEKRKS